MTTETSQARIDDAVRRNKERKGNCSQAILCTYADLIPADQPTAFALGEGLSSGFGSENGTCGSFAAASLVVGAVMSNRAFNLDKCLEVVEVQREMRTYFAKCIEDELGFCPASLSCGDILRGSHPLNVPCWKTIRAAARTIEHFVDDQADDETSKGID